MKTTAMVALWLGAWASPALAATWQCVPDSEIVCSAGACQSVQPTTRSLVDFDSSAYSRCDSKSCDRYPMVSAKSGIFVSVQFAPGTLFKATADGSAYVEVVTLGVQTYSYFGRCQ